MGTLITENFVVLKMNDGVVETLTTQTSRVAVFSTLDDARFQEVFVLERVENTNTWKVIKQAHYRWTSYRHHALGQANTHLSPHPLYRSLGRGEKSRQATYRRLFRTELDQEAIDDIRLALNQNQPLGSSRFYAKIASMTGQRREPKPRGRLRKERDGESAIGVGQDELPI